MTALLTNFNLYPTLFPGPNRSQRPFSKAFVREATGDQGPGGSSILLAGQTGRGHHELSFGGVGDIDGGWKVDPNKA